MDFLIFPVLKHQIIDFIAQKGMNPQATLQNRFHSPRAEEQEDSGWA